MVTLGQPAVICTSTGALAYCTSQPYGNPWRCLYITHLNTRRITKKQLRDSHGLRNKLDSRGRCNANKRGPKVLTAEDIAAAEEIQAIRRGAIGDVMNPDAHTGFDAKRYARWFGSRTV